MLQDEDEIEGMQRLGKSLNFSSLLGRQKLSNIKMILLLSHHRRLARVPTKLLLPTDMLRKRLPTSQHAAEKLGTGPSESTFERLRKMLLKKMRARSCRTASLLIDRSADSKNRPEGKTGQVVGMRDNNEYEEIYCII